MIVEYIRYRIPAAAQADFLAAYGAAARALDASPFCLNYELAQGAEESERFILRIHWTSAEDHLRGFRSSSEFRDFLAQVKPYLGNVEEMQHYRPTAVTARDIEAH